MHDHVAELVDGQGPLERMGDVEQAGGEPQHGGSRAGAGPVGLHGADVADQPDQPGRAIRLVAQHGPPDLDPADRAIRS